MLRGLLAGSNCGSVIYEDAVARGTVQRIVIVLWLKLARARTDDNEGPSPLNTSLSPDLSAADLRHPCKATPCLKTVIGWALRLSLTGPMAMLLPLCALCFALCALLRALEPPPPAVTHARTVKFLVTTQFLTKASILVRI